MKITKQKLREIIREELKSIKEEINAKQSINEGLWSGIKTRGLAYGINGKTGTWLDWGLNKFSTNSGKFHPKRILR